jgi:DNA-binding IclR family transcriptional regulator
MAAMTRDSATSPPSAQRSLDQRYIVPGLLRGLQILRTFSREKQEQTVAEMARAVGIPRSTAFRIVYTLENSGFLHRKGEEGTRYQLGSPVLELGYSFLAGKELIDIANPILRRLRDETSASSHLAVREGRNVVYIARFQGNTSLVSAMSVGSRLPAHATAPGRVLLSALPLSEVVALYEDYNFETYTSDTPDTIGALVNLVERDRKEGSIVSWGFYEAEVASIAAPVRNSEGKVEAAISVSCPISVYDRDTFSTRIRRIVEEAAADISRGLGYRSRNTSAAA